MNDTLSQILLGVAGLVNLICFIMVVIQMFQRGATTMGIVCIVLALCCGLGGLIAFIFGWVKAGQWNISKLMTVWTVAVVIEVVISALNPAPFEAMRNAMPH